MKRRVKRYLQSELGAGFKNCVISSMVKGSEHHTYGVNQAQIPHFKVWAESALQDLGLIL
jgi:hypothetical protein